MELSEKNGHASIEEILASVRRIIAEEPAPPSPVIDLGKPAHYPRVAHYPRGDGLLEDPSDFDLPSIFRPQPVTNAADKPAPLFGRLSEAIRSASNGAAERGEPSLSTLKLQRSDTVDAAGAPSFLLSTFHQTTAPRADELAAQVSDDAPAAPSTAEPAVIRPAAMTMPPQADDSPAEPNSAAPAPQVPRQMAAFKDTRFRGMGSSPAHVEPTPSFVSPFEAAATAALLASAGPAPAPFTTELEPENLASAPFTPGVVDAVAEEAPASLAAAIAASYPALAMDAPAASLASATLVPAPSVPATPAFAAPQPPPVPSPQSVASPDPAAPIEDSTADLLRPMLRQWLAENMPRMVEKALHIEVAETVKSTKK